MLLERRAGMFKHSRLPSEYQEVEWISSNGEAYTNLFTNDNTTPIVVDLTLKFSEGVNYCGYSQGYAGSWFGTLDSEHFTLGGGINLAGDTTKKQNIRVSTYAVGKNAHTELTTEYGVIERTGSTAWTTSIGAHTFSPFRISPTQFAQVTIYSCKIMYRNALHNYVPCYRKADSVIGLYDIIDNQFFTNEGTGTFIKGANV